MGYTSLETIKLQGQEYFIEYDDQGNLYLTRCLSECRDCPHYDNDCREHNYPDGDFCCDKVIPDVRDTYDIYAPIASEEYPELTEDEVGAINKLFIDGRTSAVIHALDEGKDRAAEADIKFGGSTKDK